jgi:hypothetical protein
MLPSGAVSPHPLADQGKRLTAISFIAHLPLLALGADTDCC